MSMEVQQKRFNSMERRPRMLKDFLNDQNSNSFSSSGFRSLSRKPNDTNNMHSLIEMELKSNNRKNSSNKFSPFQTLVNTITSISFFTAVKKSHSMNFLPRSLSRKLSSSSRRRRSQSFCKGGSSTVKIKDIIRWKSFRDLVEEHHHHQPSVSPPLDFHHHCLVGSTTTTTTTTCSSSGSSWCDSDFTSGYLSSWELAQNGNVEAGNKKFTFSPLVVVGKESVEPETVTAEYTAVGGAKEVLTCQEYEQQSPVSVLQVGEDEFSPFDQSLANIERRKQKFMQTVQRLESLAKFDLENLEQSLLLGERVSGYDEDDDEHDDEEVEEQDWVEERARQLLQCVKANDSMQSCKDYLDTLLLDFLREELAGMRNQTWNDDDRFELEILRKAEDWINGSFAYDIELVHKDTYIKDMDRTGRWSRFEEEKDELTLEIEAAILHSLVGDLLDLDG